MQAIRFPTMGCHAQALIDSDIRGALEGLPEWFHARERVLSRFDPRSALSALNRDGRRSPAEELLWRAVDVALRVADETDGLVTPTVLRALERAGYDRSFDALDPTDASRRRPIREPDAPDVERAVPAPDHRSIERDARTRTLRLPAGVSLDLAGTAKAWSIDEAADALARFGPTLVEVGGDLAMRGAPSTPWPIAVGDPRGGDALDLLLVARGGIATSGRDHRRWQRLGRALHHLIDPRTGEPAETDVLSATVVGPTALEADVAAKRVLLEGSEAGLAWIESTADLAAIVVTERGRVLRSRRIAAMQWRDAA